VTHPTCFDALRSHQTVRRNAFQLYLCVMDTGTVAKEPTKLTVVRAMVEKVNCTVLFILKVCPSKTAH